MNKMIKDKKGMEIAVSTLVGMILGALMFFAGVALLANVMLSVDKSHDQISEQMEQDIINAFDSNEPIYIHKNPLSPSSKDKSVIFAIGIHNIYETKREFNISIVPGDDYTEFPDAQQIAYFDVPFEISSRQKHVEFVIVPVKNIPKNEQYSLTLKVTHNNGSEFVDHGNPRILYVNT